MDGIINAYIQGVALPFIVALTLVGAWNLFKGLI